MAQDPYYWTQNLFNLESQRQALGQSKGMTPREVSSAIESGVDVQRAFGERERQMALQEREARAREKQGKIAGITGLTQLAINAPLAYMSAKNLGWIGKSPAVQPVATQTTGAPAAISGTEAGVGSGAIGFTPSGTIGMAPSELAGFTPTETIGFVPGVTEASAASATMETGGGMTAMGALPWVAGGIAAYELNKKYHITRQIAHGSIICTELNRQGLLPDSMLRASSFYVRTKGDKQAYIGYLIFADPIVEKMKKSKIWTMVMYPYGMIMSRECASRVCKMYKSTWFSRGIYNASEWFYKSYFNWKFRREVVYG